MSDPKGYYKADVDEAERAIREAEPTAIIHPRMDYGYRLEISRPDGKNVFTVYQPGRDGVQSEIINGSKRAIAWLRREESDG